MSARYEQHERIAVRMVELHLDAAYHGASLERGCTLDTKGRYAQRDINFILQHIKAHIHGIRTLDARAMMRCKRFMDMLAIHGKHGITPAIFEMLEDVFVEVAHIAEHRVVTRGIDNNVDADMVWEASKAIVQYLKELRPRDA